MMTKLNKKKPNKKSSKPAELLTVIGVGGKSILPTYVSPNNLRLWNHWQGKVRRRLEHYLLTPCPRCDHRASLTGVARECSIDKGNLWRFVWKDKPIVWSSLLYLDTFLEGKERRSKQ